MKKLLLILIAVICMCGEISYAQHFGGQDVLVCGDNQLPMNTKMAVAENGMIFIAVLKEAETKKLLEIHLSKDNGERFAKLTEYSGTELEIKDWDIAVTGNTEENITLWLAAIGKINTMFENGFVITKCDVKGNLLIMPPHYFKQYSLDDIFYGVSISTDYPLGLNPGRPFSIAAALTRRDKEGTNYLDYFYSINGGENFVDKGSIYIQRVHKKRFGKIDLSLGGSRYYPYGISEPAVNGTAGIVFEIGMPSIPSQEQEPDRGNIAFIANDYKFSGTGWTEPIIVTGLDGISSGNSANPKIQWYRSKDINYESKQNHYFVIAHDLMGTTENIRIVYPKLTFDISQPPTTDDYGAYLLGGIGEIEKRKSPDLAFDNINNSFLMTYVLSGNKNNYQRVKHSYVHEEKGWEIVGYYNDNPGVNQITLNPLVAFHPLKEKACFIWKQNSMLGMDILFDSEWGIPTSIANAQIPEEAISVLHSPISENVIINLKKTGGYAGTLYDLQGKQVKSFNFSGNEYTFSSNGLAKGVYLLKLCGTTGDYTAKLMVK